MIKLLSLLIVVWLLLPIKGSEATVALGSPDLMAFPCDTGYYRQAPHVGVTSSPLSFSGLTSGNVCTAFSALSVPTPSIDFMLVDILMTSTALGGVATRNNLVTVYVDSTCTTPFDQTELNIYEQTATGAGTELARIRRQVWVPVVVVGNVSSIYYKYNNQGTSIAQFAKLAYYDH